MLSCRADIHEGVLFYFRLPESDGIKDDLAIRTSLERKPRSEFILFVDDGDRFVFVGIAVTVNVSDEIMDLYNHIHDEEAQSAIQKFASENCEN